MSLVYIVKSAYPLTTVRFIEYLHCVKLIQSLLKITPRDKCPQNLSHEKTEVQKVNLPNIASGIWTHKVWSQSPHTSQLSCAKYSVFVSSPKGFNVKDHLLYNFFSFPVGLAQSGAGIYWINTHFFWLATSRLKDTVTPIELSSWRKQWSHQDYLLDK